MSLTILSCRTCGAPIPPGSPFGHCPCCLLGLGLEESPSEAPVASASSELTDDYELLEELGHGSMGVVFKARQVSLNRLVALKMLGPHASAYPGLADRLRLEAEAAGSLAHPHIVTIYDVGEENGQPFFSMRLIEGANLAKAIGPKGFSFLTADSHPISSPAARQRTSARLLTRLFRRNHPPFEEGERQKAIARLMSQIARAVHYAHTHAVLHRDLKPSNIILHPNGEPHLTDFGLAKMLTRAAATSAPSGATCLSPRMIPGPAPSETRHPNTASGAIIGTPCYMAPELAAGDGANASTAADIYSLGAILYEMFTGRPPFRAATQSETLRQVVEDPVIPPAVVGADLDPDLVFACLKCLEKDPQRRYPTALSLAEDLERWLRGEPIEGRPLRPAEKLWRWSARNPMLAGLVVGVFLLLTGVALLSTILFQLESMRVDEMTVLQGLQSRDLLLQIEKARSAGGTISFSANNLALLTGRVPRATDLPLVFGLQLRTEQPDKVLDHLTHLIKYFYSKVAVRPGRHLALAATIYSNRATLTQGLATGEVELMRADAAAYVLTRATNSRVVPLVQQVLRDNWAGPRAALFVRGDAAIDRLEQFKGRMMAVAFGEQGTADGDYLPKAALVAHGLRRSDFQRVTNLLSGAVITAVSDGLYDVGVADLEEISLFTNSPSLQVRLKVLQQLGCPNAPWVATEKLDPAVAEAVRQGLLSLRDPDVLAHVDYRLTGFLPVQPSDYDDLMQQMEKARLFDQPGTGEPDDQRSH